MLIELCLCSAPPSHAQQSPLSTNHYVIELYHFCTQSQQVPQFMHGGTILAHTCVVQCAERVEDGMQGGNWHHLVCAWKQQTLQNCCWNWQRHTQSRIRDTKSLRRSIKLLLDTKLLLAATTMGFLLHRLHHAATPSLVAICGCGAPHIPQFRDVLRSVGDVERALAIARTRCACSACAVQALGTSRGPTTAGSTFFGGVKQLPAVPICCRYVVYP